MTTFEDLGLPMELVEGLMAAGAEEPTRLQADATPVLMRGNPAVLAAGPGAGTLWAWAAPTLARVMEDETPGSVLVLTRSAEMADEVAEVVGRLAAAAGLRVVGEGRQWVLPELAHVHVLSATAAAERLSRSNLSLDPVRTVVIDAGTTEEALAPASRVLEAVPTGVQKVMVALPLTSAVDRFTEQHLRKAVHIPPRFAAEMAPFVAMAGEFRVHYAGFFDPGFGHAAAGGAGARGVLEVRCHEAPFVLEHGQIVGRLVYERMDTVPERLYGAGIASNYQGQGLKLAKHFRD